MSRPALPRRRGLYIERGVPRDEMILGDIVQSFAARDLVPTESGSGYCLTGTFLGEERRCSACALTALVTHQQYEDGEYPGAGVSFAAALGWDSPRYTTDDQQQYPIAPYKGLDMASYNAGFAAWEAMHTTEAEAVTNQIAAEARP